MNNVISYKNNNSNKELYQRMYMIDYILMDRRTSSPKWVRNPFLSMWQVKEEIECLLALSVSHEVRDIRIQKEIDLDQYVEETGVPPLTTKRMHQFGQAYQDHADRMKSGGLFQTLSNVWNEEMNA